MRYGAFQLQDTYSIMFSTSGDKIVAIWWLLHGLNGPSVWSQELHKSICFAPSVTVVSSCRCCKIVCSEWQQFTTCWQQFQGSNRDL